MHLIGNGYFEGGSKEWEKEYKPFFKLNYCLIKVLLKNIIPGSCFTCDMED